MSARAEQLINAVQALDPRADSDEVLLHVVRFARPSVGAAGVALVHPSVNGVIEVRAGDIVEGGREVMRRLFATAYRRFESEAVRVTDAEQGTELCELEILVDEHRVMLRTVPDDPEEHLLMLWFVDEDEDDADLDRTLTPAQSTIVDVLVDLVGERLARGRGAAEVERRAVRRERDRIARDLHDVVIQRIYAAGLQVQAMRRCEDQDAARAKIDGVVGDLDRVITDIRTVIFELDHEVGAGLRDDLRHLVGEYARVLGFGPVLHTTGELDRLDAVVGGHLLATVRELLSNVARHAGAEGCRVGVTHENGWLEVEVSDDGIGIDPETLATGRRSGLANLELRANLMRGELVAKAARGRGAVFTWTIPVERN